MSVISRKSDRQACTHCRSSHAGYPTRTCQTVMQAAESVIHHNTRTAAVSSRGSILYVLHAMFHLGLVDYAPLSTAFEESACAGSASAVVKLLAGCIQNSTRIWRCLRKKTHLQYTRRRTLGMVLQSTFNRWLQTCQSSACLVEARCFELECKHAWLGSTLPFGLPVLLVVQRVHEAGNHGA